MVLLVVTWLVDLLWMVYWIPHWNSDEMKDWQKGLHNMVIFCSVINFLMKLAVIIMLSLTQKDTIRNKMTEMQNISNRGGAGNIGGA